jgi:Lsr2
VGTREIRFCDISGSEDDVETHEVTIDQMNVEIDLAPAEYRKFLALLQPYIQGGRVDAAARNFTAPLARKPARARAPVLTATERAQLRSWVQDNGIAVPSNSRFKHSIIERWRHESLLT